MKSPVKHIESYGDEVGLALEALAQIQRFDLSRTKGHRLRQCQDWIERGYAASAAVLIASAVLGGILLQAKAPWDWRHPMVLALLVAMALSLLLPVLAIALDLYFLFHHVRHPGQSLRAEQAHDALQARALLVLPAHALASADAWMAMKMKRMERRLLRMVGGPDKVAVLVVAATAWAAWREIHLPLSGLPLDALQLGLAFLAGLSLGAMSVSRMLDRMAYQRDMAQLALEFAGFEQSGSAPIQT